MVLRQLLTSLRRHPLVVVAGALLTILMAGVVYQWPPVYSTRASALFLNPQPAGTAASELVNPYQGSRENLVMAAGVVSRMLDQGGSSTKAGSDTVSLVGMGVKSGYSVTLPNSGSQWVYEFRKAQLDVQVVGRSEEEVRRLLAQAMSEIEGALRVRQQESGAPEEQWIRLAQSPREAVIVAQSGDRRRAAAMVFVIGTLLTLTAVQALREDRRLLPDLLRRRRAAGPPPPPPDDPLEPLFPEPAGVAGRSPTRHARVL